MSLSTHTHYLCVSVAKRSTDASLNSSQIQLKQFCHKVAKSYQGNIKKKHDKNSAPPAVKLWKQLKI